MKELSIEQKARRYDEVLERARKINNGEPINVLDGTLIPVAIFPELKESEDEKIRQFLIHEIKETSDEIMSYRNMNKKDVIAWLEKQKWSKEDEKMYKEVLTDIIYVRNDLEAKGCLGLSKRAMKAFNWFSKRYKSLTPQNTWKPSEEQLTQLSNASNRLYYNCETLLSLLEQLKKLRG